MVFAIGLAALPVTAACARDETAPDARTAELLARYDNRTRVYRPCPAAAPGEIMVCGNQAPQRERYRLPLPVESAPAGLLPGEAPRASAAPLKQGGCGIVRGDPPLCNLGMVVVKMQF